MRSIFALVDCNNFYASCERVFNPKLERKPVVVLSNNDGCIIARSEEAKELGIKMGTPLFKAQPVIKAHGVHVFSSNYPLYGDMSQRVMKTLGQFTPDVEVYSIDEAFLDLSHYDGRDLTECGRAIRSTVKQWTGIPVSVGIAPTKTLAKVANHLAKKSAKAAGVLDLTDPALIDKALERTPVESLWGIGRNWGKMMREERIATARELRDRPDGWVRRRMGIVGLRMVQELRGIPCITVDSTPSSRRGVSYTRSFSESIISLEVMQQAIALFASKAGEKLRRGKLAARTMVVFLGTNRFTDDNYFHSALVEFPMATDDTPELIEYAFHGIARIFRDGERYRRAGVMLTELIPVSEVQTQIFDEKNRDRSRAVMNVLDEANSRLGKSMLRYAVVGTKHSWQGRSDMRSWRYTTAWEEVLRVRA